MLHHVSTGSGPVIIFVHGNSQNYTVWNEVVSNPALRNYTCIAIDLPGQGQSFRSDHPEKDYKLRAMAQYLVNFTDGYSEHGYLLVASSLGTNYIAEGAYHFKNCKGAFLTGACIIGENIMPDDIILPNPNFAPTFAATATEAELNGLMGDEAYHVSEELKARLKKMYRDTDPHLRTTLGTSIAQQEYGDEIGNLWKQNIPIAVVYGAEDKLISPDYMQKLNLKLWRDEIIKLPKAGHCCQFDEPGLIAQMVADFAADCLK
jgi:pimeloyl-ACP methyl ester carboxylesterase